MGSIDCCPIVIFHVEHRAFVRAKMFLINPQHVSTHFILSAVGALLLLQFWRSLIAQPLISHISESGHLGTVCSKQNGVPIPWHQSGFGYTTSPRANREVNSEWEPCVLNTLTPAEIPLETHKTSNGEIAFHHSQKCSLKAIPFCLSCTLECFSSFFFNGSDADSVSVSHRWLLPPFFLLYMNINNWVSHKM